MVTRCLLSFAGMACYHSALASVSPLFTGMVTQPLLSVEFKLSLILQMPPTLECDLDLLMDATDRQPSSCPAPKDSDHCTHDKTILPCRDANTE
jgi:hypothetical protein